MYVVYVNGCFLDVHYLEQYFVCMVVCICKWLFLRCPLS